MALRGCRPLPVKALACCGPTAVPRFDINSYAQTNNVFDWHQLDGIVTFRPRAAFARKRIEKPPRRHGALVHSADAISSILMLIPLPSVSPRDFTGSGSTFSA